MCEEESETVKTHSKVARLCCELFSNMTGVKWIMPPDVKSLLSEHQEVIM